MYAIAPNGHLIVASCDFVPANAMIVPDSFRRDPDGSIDFDWEGDTKMCWDGQYTVRRDGQDVYVEQMYRVVADDGWIGAAWEEELEPLSESSGLAL